MHVSIKNDNEIVEKYNNVVQINETNEFESMEKSDGRKRLSLINKENETKRQYIIKSDQILLIQE